MSYDFVSQVGGHGTIARGIDGYVARGQVINTARGRNIGTYFLRFKGVSSSSGPCGLVIAAGRAIFGGQGGGQAHLLVGLMFQVGLFGARLMTITQGDYNDTSGSSFAILYFSINGRYNQICGAHMQG